MQAAQSSKRKLKSVTICTVVVVLFVVCAGMAMRGSGIETEMAKLRASGLPVRVEDLNAWYTAVPEQSNSALSVLAAAELRNQGEFEALDTPRRGEPIAAEHLDQIEAYVRTNESAIQTLRAGLRLPESRYPITLPGTMVANGIPNANLGEIKGLARLLHFERCTLFRKANRRLHSGQFGMGSPSPRRCETSRS